MAVGGLGAGEGPPVGSRLEEGIIPCCVSPHERPPLRILDSGVWKCRDPIRRGQVGVAR